MSLDSEYRKHSAHWEAVYAAVGSILGTAYQILNFGDQLRAGKVNATTFEARGALGGTLPSDQTWTPNAPWHVNDDPFDLTDPENWLGHIPILRLNGTDEEADTPDDAFYSRVTAAFSIGMWIRPDAVNVNVLMSKGVLTTASEDMEWRLQINNGGELELALFDTSQATTNWLMFRASTAVLVPGRWVFVVVTVNATQTAATDINLYVNGVLSNGTATKQAAFAAMEAGAGKVLLGHEVGTAGNDRFYDGQILGGPLGPFFAQKELSAAEVLELEYIGAHAAGLG